jgi:hypothetical protein
MPQTQGKQRVVVGKVSLDLPAFLAKGQGAPIDSAANVFEGNGLTVIVDEGAFADRLESYSGRPEYRAEPMSIAGTTGRLVFFRSPDLASYTLAAHLPAPRQVTIVVQAHISVQERIARDIIESLQLLD